MEPGRELDALIEWHVFKNRVDPSRPSWQNGYNSDDTFYSTSDADALRAAKHIDLFDGWVLTYNAQRKVWIIADPQPGWGVLEGVIAEAPTLAHVICLAVLTTEIGDEPTAERLTGVVMRALEGNGDA